MANIHLQTGRVVRFDQSKGYGFITIQGQKDMFVHASQIKDEDSHLKQGEDVEFVTGTSKRTGKVEAMEVRRIKKR